MTAKNLSTVTTDLIASYGNTAKNVIHAYRAGGERVIGFMDRRWERALEKSGKQLKAEVRGNAEWVHRKLSAYYSKGINVTTGGADIVVDTVVELAGKGVQKVAASADRFEQRTGVAALTSIARVAVTAVSAVSNLAGKLEQRSSLLARRMSARKVGSKAAAVKRVTPFKKARSRKAV